MFQRHYNKQPNMTSPVSGRNARGEASCLTVIRTEKPSKLPFSVSQMVDDFATEFFFAKHVFRESGIARGHFEFLSVYTTRPKANETLSASLKAATLAAYAHKFHYPALLQRSRIYYDLALNRLQQKVQAPTEAVKSSTIVAMMLLGAFETLNCENINSLSNTDAHMSGALRCISLRADPILKSQHGLQLFLQTSWCRLVTCILRSRPIPKELIETRRHASHFLPIDDPAWKLSEIMERVARFRAEFKRCVLHDNIRIVDIALGLDQELLALAENMPFGWEFRRILSEQDPELVFASYYHVYPDLWVACIWNFIRACRLVLLKEIRLRANRAPTVLLPLLSSRYGGNYRQLDAIVQFLTSEICATVPQFCDYLQDLHHVVPINKTDVPTTASVYHLFWPLLNAAQSTSFDSQWSWIINRCRVIGRTTGIQQVFALADFLETREDIDSWVDRQDEKNLSSLNIGK
jgi:hypothetical protein